MYIYIYTYLFIYYLLTLKVNPPNTQVAPRTLRPIGQVKGMHRHLTCVSSLNTSPVLPG